MSRDTRRLNEQQFTQTAREFAASRALDRRLPNEELLRLTSPARDDRVLDVACGAGALLATYAPAVRRAVGVDLTMAMLDEAMARGSRGQGVLLVRGAAEQLPFRDEAFSIVVTTWAVHHFADPRPVVREMVRVCRPGGRVAIGDSVGDEDEGKRARQNAIEQLRDPSHVEMRSQSGLMSLLAAEGLIPGGTASGSLPRELEEWCRVAATPPETAARLRAMLLETIPGDVAGLAPFLDGETLRFRHRWAIAVARRP
jgi:ubiquinone/menaquinone biosynthesis C-methylase UbiE